MLVGYISRNHRFFKAARAENGRLHGESVGLIDELDEFESAQLPSTWLGGQELVSIVRD